MNNKLKFSIVVVAIVAVLMFTGCVEDGESDTTPSQDLIDMIETKSDIRFSNWNVKEFNDGYIVTADSYPGGKPIWYIENNNVYWVNGKSNTVSLVSEEAPENIQNAILYPELVAKRDAEKLANKNRPYLTLDNPNYNIIDKNEIYYWTYDDEDSIILCNDHGFGLYEKLPDSLLDRGEKFAETNPCGKTLKLNVLKEATHKNKPWVYWLVDYENSVGWVSKGWLEENNK